MTLAWNEKHFEFVVPRGLLRARWPESDAGGGGSADHPVARRLIEVSTMTAIINVGLALGNSPKDASAEGVGYDIAPLHASTDHLHINEGNGWIDGSESVPITRQEAIASLHDPEKFILAIFQVAASFGHASSHVRDPLVERDLSLIETAFQFTPRRLLEWVEAAL
jgi:hypothetical protein